MPQITDIKPQKKKNRVNIYIDGKFSFGLDLENFVVLGLKVGKELTQDEIEEIIKKADFSKTFDKLIRFAFARPRSKKEVTDWFRRKEVHESIHEELLDKLKRLELLDDTKFASWWVTQRTAFRPKSKMVLTMELRQKGIDKDIIKETLLGSGIDELSLAKQLIEKKKRVWEKLEGQDRKKKITYILGSKGFGWDIIKEILKGSEANPDLSSE
jgi:regulatory protein